MNQKQFLSQILFSSKGRLWRKPYWLYGNNLPWGVIIGGSLVYVGLTADASSGFAIFLSPFILALLWINTATGIKCLHDRDMRASWYLIIQFPYISAIGLLINFMLPSTVGENRYGPDSRDLS